jgi:ribonuclease P protein component
MPTPLEPRDQGLSREQRLKASRLFEETFAQRRRASGRCLTLWLRRGPAAARRLGVVASRRLGGAVTRNRAKRRLREAFRLNRHRFRTDADVVLVARPGALTASWAELQQDLLDAARRLGALDGEAESAP